MIAIEFVGMFIIFNYTKHPLSKSNVSWIVSTISTATLLFFFFFFFYKMALFNFIHPLKIYSQTKFHDRTLTGASIASTSEVLTPAILEWLKLRDWKVWRRGHSQWHNLPTEFHKIFLFQKLLGGQRRTDRIVIS
jgi:hypothetical protein